MGREKENEEIPESIAERDKRCIAKYARGLSEKEICKSENITQSALTNIFFKAGVSRRIIFKERKENEFKDSLHKALLKAHELNRIPINSELKAMNISYALVKEIRYELKKRGYKTQHLRSKIRIKDDKLLNDLKRVAILLNKTPNMHEIEKHSKYGVGTFYEHFGSIVKAQELAGLKPNKRGAPAGNLNWMRLKKGK